MAYAAVAQALVLEAPRRLVVRELPLPNLGDDDALVRVAACGLCGTDHKQYTSELAGGFAFVPGHETVGTIDAIGAWRMVASILHSLQVPLEDGVASWPPDGLAPRSGRVWALGTLRLKRLDTSPHSAPILTAR